MIIRDKNIEKFINYSGKKLNAPQQSIIMGVSSLVFQPYINRKNKQLDEDTRDMAVARSIGKSITGNISDFLTRVFSIFAVAKLSNYAINKVNTDDDFVMEIKPKSKLDIFTPNLKEDFVPRPKKEFLKDFKSYRMAMGALVATGLAVFVKTTVELPATKFLTDYFYRKERLKKEKNAKTDSNE